MAADVAGLSNIFSDAKAYTSDSLPRPAAVREEEERELEKEGQGGDAGDWGLREGDHDSVGLL